MRGGPDKSAREASDAVLGDATETGEGRDGRERTVELPVLRAIGDEIWNRKLSKFVPDRKLPTEVMVLLCQRGKRLFKKLKASEHLFQDSSGDWVGL